MEDRYQAMRLARAQVIEIDVRDQLARQIAVALDSQDLLLELHQAAAFKTQLPEPARAVQQVEVMQTREGRFPPGEAIARFEQRLVVGFAVIRDQNVKIRQMR